MPHLRPVYDFDDYKTYLLHLEEHSEGRGFRSKLASILHCGKSFISQILGGDLHLGPDHAFALCEHWRFAREETDYFLDLVAHDRAGTKRLKAHFSARLAAARKAHREPSQRFKWSSLEAGAQARYYASWLPGAIHVAADIPGCDTVEGMARRFSLPHDAVARCVEDLLAADLLRKDGARLLLNDTRLHLPKGSPALQSHHTNWHLKALESARSPIGEGFHYSSVFTMSASLAPALQARLLNMVEAMNGDIGASPSEEVYAFTVGLFRPFVDTR